MTSYKACGRLTKIHTPHGVIEYAYDDLGRKTATWTGAGETLLSGFEYAYNADGGRASESAVNEDGQVTTKTWSYDGLNRLVRETFDGVDGSGEELQRPVVGRVLPTLRNFYALQDADPVGGETSMHPVWNFNVLDLPYTRIE